MFRIAICDDEQVICSQIENILLDYSKRTSLEIDIIVFIQGKNCIDIWNVGTSLI
jgi:hypothetical protein